VETRLSDFDDDPLTVSEVTDRVARLVEKDPILEDVRVRGEISGFSEASSGHMYFDLKDEDTVLKCVMFRQNNSSLEFEPEDGDDVVVEGNVGVYAQRGEYQLYARSMERGGRGELYEEYLRLKEDLSEEGLFDDRHKKALPDYPTTVGVVTSDSGAALHDIRDVVGRRFGVRLVLAPTRVQGEEAAPEIVDAVRRLDSFAPDVMVVGRGGGSLEDLWAFNEEAVARAVASTETPVVSAVGHEVDTTLADLAADERAATPSEAAELVVPDGDELSERIDALEDRMLSSAARLVEDRRRVLESHERVLRRAPVLNEYAQRLDELDDALRRGIEDALEDARTEVEENARLLESVSPLQVLSRGYSVVEREGGGIVESAGDVSEGDSVVVRLKDGEADATVEGTRRDG